MSNADDITPRLEEAQIAFLEQCRAGRLATADAAGKPHCVPVCYAWAGQRLWIPLDEKPKSGRKLRRLRNLEENPQACLTIDRYLDDWSRLAFLMLDGKAALKPLTAEALEELRRRYYPYRTMQLSQGICLEIEHVVFWRAEP